MTKPEEVRPSMDTVRAFMIGIIGIRFTSELPGTQIKREICPMTSFSFSERRKENHSFLGTKLSSPEIDHVRLYKGNFE